MTAKQARGTPRSDMAAQNAKGRDIEQQDYYVMLDLSRQLERDKTALREALMIVYAGLLNGNVKSKPIIRVDLNADTVEMESLTDIVAAALQNAKGTE